MKFLILGGKGQIGWELCRVLSTMGEVVAPNSKVVDLTKSPTLQRAVKEIGPDVIVNAAAYTAVDRAETEAELAHTINAEGPRVLAEEAKRHDALLVHYSTDYVFDGHNPAPSVETDPTGPLNVYGRTKLAGEQAIGEAGPAHLIFRTSWVYGLRGQNFLLTMLKLFREREELRVVADQTGTPNWSRMLADATALILSQVSRYDQARVGKLAGLYHLSAGGSTNWHAFTQEILELDPRPEEHKVKQLLAIPTSDYPTPAERPRNSTLDCEKLARDFGLRPASWLEILRLAMADRAVAGEA